MPGACRPTKRVTHILKTKEKKARELTIIYLVWQKETVRICAAA
jgi:hypothetical protein